jgi:hypothetical protein
MRRYKKEGGWGIPSKHFRHTILISKSKSDGSFRVRRPPTSRQDDYADWLYTPAEWCTPGFDDRAAAREAPVTSHFPRSPAFSSTSTLPAFPKFDLLHFHAITNSGVRYFDTSAFQQKNGPSRAPLLFKRMELSLSTLFAIVRRPGPIAPKHQSPVIGAPPRGGDPDRSPRRSRSGRDSIGTRHALPVTPLGHRTRLSLPAAQRRITLLPVAPPARSEEE